MRMFSPDASGKVGGGILQHLLIEVPLMVGRPASLILGALHHPLQAPRTAAEQLPKQKLIQDWGHVHSRPSESSRSTDEPVNHPGQVIRNTQPHVFKAWDLLSRCSSDVRVMWPTSSGCLLCSKPPGVFLSRLTTAGSSSHGLCSHKSCSLLRFLAHLRADEPQMALCRQWSGSFWWVHESLLSFAFHDAMMSQ